VHTQYDISRDQQVCVPGVGSDSEVQIYMLLIELRFIFTFPASAL
jgi:hypothetical protein